MNNEICERLYYSDLTNAKRELMIQYQTLLKNRRYTDATSFLYENSALRKNPSETRIHEKEGLWYLGKELLDFIDTEIKKCVDNANEMEVIQKIFITVDDEQHPYPTEIYDGAHWIGDIDNENIVIDYASNISELYTGNETGLIE